MGSIIIVSIIRGDLSLAIRGRFFFGFFLSVVIGDDLFLVLFLV